MKKSITLLKGSFLKRGVLSLLLGFLFVAAAQTDVNAQNSAFSAEQNAQQPPARELGLLPKGNFVSVEVAKTRLYDAMKLLRNQLATLQSGTGVYNDTFRRYSYYSGIHTNLNAGKSVPQSIVDGLMSIRNVMPVLATPEQALAEKNVAVNLLRP